MKLVLVHIMCLIHGVDLKSLRCRPDAHDHNCPTFQMCTMVHLSRDYGKSIEFFIFIFCTYFNSILDLGLIKFQTVSKISINWP